MFLVIESDGSDWDPQTKAGKGSPSEDIDKECHGSGMKFLQDRSDPTYVVERDKGESKNQPFHRKTSFKFKKLNE